MPLGAADPVADELEAGLRAAGTPERAAGEKRYLKSYLDHFGATLPECRGQVRAFVKRHPDLTNAELAALVGSLWSRAIFECRMAAVLLLESYPDRLGRADLALIKALVGDSHTWALVDPLAANVLGGLIVRQPGTASKLDAWAADEDFWVRRAALLSQLAPLKRGEPFDRFARYADAMLDEREFFIRKAIGWVLREHGKREPDLVFKWLAPRIDRASGVTVREAVKYLDPNHRERLLSAYRAGSARKKPKAPKRAPSSRAG